MSFIPRGEPEFIPKLFTLWNAGITAAQWRRDLVAGVIVGIVALPLAIAFAIASGVSPQKGLITAIVAGLVISAFGGSRVQIGGPTGAFIVIVYGIVQKHGVEGLTIATFMAGIIILAMGLLRAGALLKYFPHTLVVGFTSGIAIIIFSSQVKELLGLRMEALPADFIGKWAAILGHAGGMSTAAVVLGLGSIAITALLPRVTTAIPGSVVAIILCTAAVPFFDLPVETIEGRFGAIPRSLPMPVYHAVDLATIRELLQPALAIALLGSIESLLSAVVADGMIGGRHRSNMELVAQGGANMLSAAFGGIPATGAIARTATNVKNGGRTPISGIVHALTLLAIMLVAAPLAGMIPLACLAGILVVVAYNMSEWQNFISVLRGNRYDAVVLVVTFLLTVVFDLVLAIEVGMVLAAFLFMKRMADKTEITQVLSTGTGEETEGLFEDEVGSLPRNVLVFEVTGPLFFGAAQKFDTVLGQINDKHHVLILRMKNVPLIDATGMHRLKDIVKHLQHRKRQVYITDLSPRVRLGLRGQEWMQKVEMRPTLEFALKDLRATA